MNLVFDVHAFKDLAWWVVHDPAMARKIMSLIEETARSPFSGTGKPEALKHELRGCWSRRINREHRLVYQVKEDEIRVLACRYHYGDR